MSGVCLPRWPAMVLVAALASCGGGTELPGPELQRRTAPVAMPLTCPRGVVVCTGEGAPVSGWLPVAGSSSSRADVAQVFEVPAPGWPGVARLLVRRDRPGASARGVPPLFVEVKAATARMLPTGPVLARGVLDVRALACTGKDVGACEGAETVVDVPLLPARGATPLLPRSGDKRYLYALVLSAEGTGAEQVSVALHAEAFAGQVALGTAARPSGAGSWPASTWRTRPQGTGTVAFALTLDATRAATCSDGASNGDETGVDCGGGCAPCATGGGCKTDADCRDGTACRSGFCVPRAAVGAACARGAECRSGVCGAVSHLCRLATCSDGKKDGDEAGLDCGGSCDGCEAGAACSHDKDCSSGACAGGACTPPSCVDGVKSQLESDVDCGGECDPCEKGKRCRLDGDCASQVCRGGVCRQATCTDGARNGTETGVDCGGSCAGCRAGQGCAAASDCLDGNCVEGACVAPSCTDGLRNGTEVDVDCGGACGPCAVGRACTSGTGCASSVCGPGHLCQEASCTDHVPNGQETDRDCGGTCPPCGPLKKCGADGDCLSGRCSGGACERATCVDGVKGVGEADVDCGGNCLARCDLGRSCRSHKDCARGVCSGGLCVAGTCSDRLKSDDETDVDCGGGTCGACAVGRACREVSDCAGRTCLGGTCRAPTCSDGLSNGAETGVDCGGPCGPCGVDKPCRVAADCTTRVCSGWACQAPDSSDGVRNGTETDVDCGGPEAGHRCAPGRRCTATRDCYRNALCQQNTCNCRPGVVCTDVLGAPGDGGGATPGPHSACASFPTGTVCTCVEGYEGDGYTCTDVDECAAGTLTCAADEVCVNLPGTAECRCPSGFVRSGQACLDVNECAAVPSVCDVNAACANTDGGYNCTCNGPDWIGDGGTCRPSNTAPVLSGWIFSPAVPTRDGPLRALPVYTDAEGDVATLGVYSWSSDYTMLDAYSGMDTLPPTAFHRGSPILVCGAVRDQVLWSNIACQWVTAGNARPTAPGISLSNTAPMAGDDVTCSVTTPSTDSDGDALTYRFTWTVNGTVVAGTAQGATASVLPAISAPVGATIRCSVSTSDGIDSSPAGTADGVVTAWGCVLICDGAGCYPYCPCTWTQVASDPLTSTPSGLVTRNGGYGGQGIASAYGRTAWKQTSDWNQAYVPSQLDPTEDQVAISADVYVPTGSGFNLGTLNESSGYNDIIKGFNFTYNATTSKATVQSYAGTSNSFICCSSPMVTVGAQAYSVPFLNGWHHVRVEHRKSTGAIRAYIDSLQVFSGTGSAITWGGRYVRLDSGAPAAMQSSNVAFSNVRVERGTGACVQ